MRKAPEARSKIIGLKGTLVVKSFIDQELGFKEVKCLALTSGWLSCMQPGLKSPWHLGGHPPHYFQEMICILTKALLPGHDPSIGLTWQCAKSTSSFSLPSLSEGGSLWRSPLWHYLRKFIQTEDPSAVVLPMEAFVCQNFQISHHFITGGQHHK